MLAYCDLFYVILFLETDPGRFDLQSVFFPDGRCSRDNIEIVTLIKEDSCFTKDSLKAFALG